MMKFAQKKTKGLEIRAQIDYREYVTGKVVDEEDFKSIGLMKDEFHGEWNYTISPRVRIGIYL